MYVCVCIFFSKYEYQGFTKNLKEESYSVN